MSLSCECGDYEGDGWYYNHYTWFIKLDTPRRKRCYSCKTLIDIGDDVIKFNRSRFTRSKVEEAIHGDEVRLAPIYFCNSCAEIFLNLTDLGYCLYLDRPMSDYLKDYHDLTGFKGKDGEQCLLNG